MHASFFEAIVDATPTAMWVTDLNDRIIYANPHAQRFTGRAMVGLSARDDELPLLVAVRASYERASASAERVDWSPISEQYGPGWMGPWFDGGKHCGTLCVIRDALPPPEHRMEVLLASLRESDQLLHAVVDELPDAIVVRDEAGDVLLTNRLGATLAATRTSTEQPAIAFEDIRDAQTGEVRHRRSIKKAFRAPNGSSRSLIVTTDITDVVRNQRRVIESEQRLQDVLRVTHEAVWDWHVPSGQVVHNRQWYEFMGFKPGDFPDTVDAFLTRLHPDDRDAVWARITDLLEGRVDVYRSEHRLFTKNDSIIRVKDRGHVVERDGEGKPLRIVGSFTDITAEARAAQELNDARIAAEQASVAKSRFLTTMSHELRTPLNGILGMAQLLLAAPQAEHRDAAQTILDSGNTLLAVLNDVLDLSKIEAGKLELTSQPFAPAAVVDEVVRLFSQTAKKRGLTLRSSINALAGVFFLGDAVRVHQMVTNLVSNALKFTAKGEVRLTLEQRATGLRFSVHDTGIGVPPQKVALLFQPFSQAESGTTRRYGGTGLGLSIVRRVAEAMGGTVGVESELGIGSCFWFEVPLAACGDVVANPGAQVPPLEHLAGITVLVVEDNPVNSKVVVALLRRLGVEVTSVENGVQAVTLLTQPSRPQLVLMDCQMPEMDGLEATSLVRAWERAHGLPAVPIVALSASAYAEDVQRCLAVGMNDFLAKPVRLEMLAVTLERCLAHPKAA